MQGGPPGHHGLGLHTREQRHGKRCPSVAGVGRGALEGTGRKSLTWKGERQVMIIQLFMALFFLLRQPQPYMGKSAPLEAELRRWSLKGHSRCLLPGYLPAQAADLLPGKTLGTLAKSSCANVKLQNDPAALPFSPTPPTSGSCG